MPAARPASVRVRTPATSANIGPGFDALGLALTLYDEIEVVLRDDGEVVVGVEGEGAGEVPLDERHLIVRAMRRTYEEAGEKLPGLELRCRNGVPHARGMGSSSSAIVAGVSAACALLGRTDARGRVDKDAVFELAADIEGHPDNVAPCVYGGFTVAWRGAAGWRAVSVPVSERVRPVLCVPAERLSTERARGLLPAQVPHADAAFNAGRAALVALAVSGHPELLLEATEDRLHESYRAPAMPRTLDLVRDLREQEEMAAVVSGAGPTVLVLCPLPGAATSQDSSEMGGLVDSIRGRAGRQWHVRPLQIEPEGAWTSSPRS